ncbi:Transcription factor MYB3R-3 [Colletotrichum spinosum]|uniref:Transcription factor MYB3R-3 n=1 Tax=Colletotrichum spinosum TaxID=1347390 RepID=A0A4R8QBZ5_9PEZI|nr:Transcription factor MYB3R-3 [Colletotrichum spinosum]
MQQWQVGPVPEYIYSNSTPQHNDMHSQHPYQQDMSRRDQHPQFQYGAPPQQSPAPHQQQQQQQHPTPVQPPMNIPQSHSQQPTAQPQHQPPPQAPPQQQAPPTTNRSRKRAAPPQPAPAPPPVVSSAPPVPAAPTAPSTTPIPPPVAPPVAVPAPQAPAADDANAAPQPPPAKKSRTNTPWTPAEELRLKQMRDAGNSWAEIAKTFPTRTEGSVKKHWYKDMHYAEFAEDESQALLNAIKEYENNKWKSIGQKVGKPAKACEQYAKEHFPGMPSLNITSARPQTHPRY